MRRALLVLLCLAPWWAQAADLLEPEKAFRFSARVLDDQAIEVHFTIADGYYLYRERFKFAADGNPSIRLGAPDLPRGIRTRTSSSARRRRIASRWRSAFRWKVPAASS